MVCYGIFWSGQLILACKIAQLIKAGRKTKIKITITGLKHKGKIAVDGNLTLTLVLVFLFSRKRFPFDSRPQTSLGEGMLLKTDREIGTDYQLK